MSIVLINIGAIVGILPEGISRLQGIGINHVETLENAWLRIGEDYITGFGSMHEAPNLDNENVVDIKKGWVFPSFCDSHTHIVYASSREREFEDKINGLSYEQIAHNGGGILNSAAKLRAATENELFEQAMTRLNEVIAKGTGAIEIKSGYGLSLDSELKMLRVIKRIKESAPVTVKTTFLGAHAVPEEFTDNSDGYVKYLCNEMIPCVAKEMLADYIDVFCDSGFFSVSQTSTILETGTKYGLKPKIHADELALSGGTKVAVEHGAVSVDHLERIGNDEIQLLAASSTIPTALPGASFFLGMPYAPAKRMIEAGLPVALASDYNPGSSPSGDMKFINSLACIKMRLTPSQALNATTINGAAAMELGESHGSISRGKKANLFVTKPLPSLPYLAYAYTTPLIEKIILNGRIL